MADFGPSINPNDFLYNKRLYYTSPFSVLKQSIVVKLTLNEENFNFDLAQSDGSDFRVTEGVSTLRMWISHWSKEDRLAVLFFKLQNVGPGVTELYNTYWGNSNIEMNSEPDKLGLPFYEEFSSSPLDSSKWTEDTSEVLNTLGYPLVDLTTITNPIDGMNSWVLEAGIYCNWATDGGFSSSKRTAGFGFHGSENDIIISIMHNDRIRHQSTEPGGGTEEYIIETNGGLEGYSKNDIYISYYEPDDKITVKLQNRNTFVDVINTINRKVEGDTRPKNLKIYPRETSYLYGAGGYPSYLDWLIIREYDDSDLGEFDTSDLYIPYETINHQLQDYRNYGQNIISITHEHESSFGGDPYKLSNSLYDSNTNVWISDEDADQEDSVNVTVNLGWSSTQLASRIYKHYDSGHVYYYNASKLSDQDLDRMRRNYWHCTTTSGWAAIKFNESRNIGAFRIKFNEDDDAGPKDYIFLGSNHYPAVNMHLAKELQEGTFEDTLEWQSVKINTNSSFKYFILDVKNTQGDENIKIQEWRMYDSLGSFEKFYPSQLRLNPVTYGSYKENFPKEIMFEGSEDGINWTTLIPWTYTYTPHVQHYSTYGYQQRYSFANMNGYWSFRLNCRGNWSTSDGKIIIGNWSLHELEEEEYTYRVLGGVSNNIQQIWAQDGTTIDDTHKIFYTANEEMNAVVDGKKVESIELPDNYNDFNVV